MSHRRVLEALTKLGLSTSEAEIYIYLCKEGPEKPQTIEEALKMKTHEQQVTLSLQRLQTKGIVKNLKTQKQLFKAEPFDKVLDLLLRAHWSETRIIQQNRTEILSQWESLVKGDIAR